MHIEHLAAFHFRNLASIDLALESRIVVLVGGNGHGKTNLLEAMYLCATGRSFRNALARELLQHEQEKGWVRASFVRHEVRHRVEASLTTARRSMRVDDRGLRQLSKLLELVNVVAFFPDDLRVIKGSPEGRRRFLDRAVGNYRSDFVDASMAYVKALRSRNVLLKGDTKPDTTLLGAYDEQLIKHGSIIHASRQQGLEALAPLAAVQFAQLMPAAGALSLTLSSGIETEESASFADSFRHALARSYPRDCARGTTSVGPHRADLFVSLDEHDARSFASQGQQRAVILSLKLAEVEMLSSRLGSAPIMLLDDVSSELDSERTGALFSRLGAMDCQILVSTTGAAPLPVDNETQLFSVIDGTVEPATKSILNNYKH